MTAVTPFPDFFLPAPGEPAIPFKIWEHIFKNYCLVIDVEGQKWTEPRQRALLLHCLGTEGQRIFYTLPETGDTLATALTALHGYFTPKDIIQNASKHELIPIIHRYLKEQGFTSAADELEKHSPQGDTVSNVSLQDMYSSWLNDGKNKRPSDSTKHSRSPKTAKATTKRKQDKLGKKTESQKKKSVSAKRKKDGKSAENDSKDKKSKTQTEDDSDSDSSLDIEKWKQMARLFTEVDIPIMDSINTLDSSAP